MYPAQLMPSRGPDHRSPREQVIRHHGAAYRAKGRSDNAEESHQVIGHTR